MAVILRATASGSDDAGWVEETQQSLFDRLDDPGANGVIPTDKSYMIVLENATGSDTARSLDVPTFLGQQLLLTADGTSISGAGQVVVTASSIFEATGLNVITFGVYPGSTPAAGANPIAINTEFVAFGGGRQIQQGYVKLCALSTDRFTGLRWQLTMADGVSLGV